MTHSLRGGVGGDPSAPNATPVDAAPTASAAIAAGGEVAQVKAGAGKASAAKAAAGRARAAKKPTTEQEDIEQLQSWQRSTDPIYVDARARLAAAEALMDAAQRGTF